LRRYPYHLIRLRQRLRCRQAGCQSEIRLDRGHLLNERQRGWWWRGRWWRWCRSWWLRRSRRCDARRLVARRPVVAQHGGNVVAVEHLARIQLAVLLAALVACTTAFAPVAQQAQNLVPLAMAPQEEAPLAEAATDSNAAALAAFATAMAPFAAQAADVDEGTLIGYGAGLVACVVSLAVGFSIGYGTLVKP